MPWVRAVLRGNTVYARADDAGALRVDGGRVEIRYKPHDGRRYDARPDNLEVLPGSVLPDDTCSPIEPAAKASGTGAAAKPARKERRAENRAPTEPPLDGDVVVAYADGACSGNPGPAGLGVVLIDGPRRVELSEYLGQATNNIAELTAILRAVGEVTDPAQKMVIRTDSQYSIGVLQKGWKAKANAELVAEVREALAARPRTRLAYVPGHSGVVLNERADALAREAVSTRKTRREVVSP
jgi:ribonuclease HI